MNAWTVFLFVWGAIIAAGLWLGWRSTHVRKEDEL